MKFKSDFSTGVVENLDDPLYRKDGALSTSLLKEMSKSPKRFHAKATGLIADSDTDCLRFGRLVHMYLLEKDRWDREVVVCPDERADKRFKENKAWWAKMHEAGAQVIREKELTDILGMAQSFNELSEVKALVNPKTEVSVFAKNFRRNVDAKCRIDLLDAENGVVVDIKTTREFGAMDTEFTKTSRYWKYPWQQVNYQDIYRAAVKGTGAPEIQKWYWAVLEKVPPYTAGIYTYYPEDLRLAQREVSQAYDTLASCMQIDAWPGYTPTKAQQISLYGNL